MRRAADEHPEAGRVELWFEDEARVGQKGRVTHVWYQKGMRPRGVREHRFASAQLFGAVCPERGAGVALVLPEVSTAAMNLFLAPELNPVEAVWLYLRERWLSHRVLAGGYGAVVDVACSAWNALHAEPGRLRSLTGHPWLPPSISIS